MKRRLDLALALVHRPRILFLDEPTTGLDIQSRTALWEEVARLAHEDGVTVFLTTQYLEEADVLANRVGIIDHGHIVAEGTPAALKAEIGAAERARDPRRGRPIARSSSPRSLPTARRSAAPRARSPSGCTKGSRVSRRSSGRWTTRACTLASLEIQAPSLDDVFLAKTGRSLEGAAEADPDGPSRGVKVIRCSRPERSRGARSFARAGSRRRSSSR